MLANRMVLASCCCALLTILACDDGGGPMRAQGSLPVGAGPVEDEEALDDEEAGKEDEPEPPAEPEPEPPDAIGLPCAVKQLLATRCQGCHAADAKNGAPLMTRDDLLAESKKDATMKVIERALLRVTASEKPMPPVGKGEPLNADEVATLRTWFEQGATAGRCDEP